MNRLLGLALGAAVLASTSLAFAAKNPEKVVSGKDKAVITVKKGTDVVVKFLGNPSAGYHWVVTAVDRSLGQPETTFQRSSMAIGSGGVAAFRWKTGGPFASVGAHIVKMEYKRPWERTSLKKIKFTIKITE